MIAVINNFFTNLNLFDLFFSIIIFYNVIQCFLKGFSLSLISFMKWIFSTIITIIMVPKLQPWVSDYIKSQFLNDVGIGVVIFISTLFLTIIIASYLESIAMNKGIMFWDSEKPEGYVPGDYNFDPFKLYNLKGDKKYMELAEIKHGRIAMLAITIFAIQEATSGLPVINF